MEVILDFKEPQLSCYSFDKKHSCYKKLDSCKKVDTLVCTSEFIKIIRYLKNKHLNFLEDINGNILIKS